MDLETLKAPAGLCGHHRALWKFITARGFHRMAERFRVKCLSGTSTRCSSDWESGR